MAKASLARDVAAVARGETLSCLWEGVDRVKCYWLALMSTLGDHLFLYWTKDIGTLTVLEVEHSAIRSARWFGLASWDTTAHWTMFCRPEEGHQPPEAMTPECAISQAEVGYHGTQWVTDTGLACIPWTDERIPENLREDKLYIDRSHVKTRNYCRNLDHDPQGPFCYVVVNNEVHRQYCRPRKCRTSGKTTPSSSDQDSNLDLPILGSLSQHKTNVLANYGTEVNELYLNETLYPENSVTEAKNYCRDPSRNIAGPWCYTTDSAAVLDLCHVPDCVKPEECTVLTRGSGTGRPIYILPQWRKTGLHFWLKEWDPDHSDGIVFILRPLEGEHYYKLTIGAENNEKVLFTYGDGKDENLLKEKALPHLIPIGKWGGFWLKILHGEVHLGYEGVDNSLFQWTSTKPEETFKPMLLTYTSLIGYTIGWDMFIPGGLGNIIGMEDLSSGAEEPPSPQIKKNLSLKNRILRPSMTPATRDGGWSEWTDWTCSVTCGGGVGIQTRTCTNPTPNVYGDMCNGSNTMKGKCNTFPCGEISPDTEEIIKHRLQTQYFSKEVDEGDIVKLECDRVTLAIIKRESPKARVVINNSTPSDSGVYLCVLYRVMGLKSTLRVVTLAVRPRWYTRANRETRAQILWCNSLTLGYVYDDLSQRWEHNGIVWKDYGITTPAAVSSFLTSFFP
uniref:(California timema) hypothetical protein n=1 Tax=Timema californicum TaxID=61474 RepID=A0A7R9J8J2_TIMCA|nr:unnamed protein product [Timema californicum]